MYFLCSAVFISYSSFVTFNQRLISGAFEHSMLHMGNLRFGKCGVLCNVQTHLYDYLVCSHKR